MNAPESIFIDERVADKMKDSDPDDGRAYVKYVRFDIAVDMMRQAAGGPEFFIQISVSPGQTMFALTNFGRLYRQKITGGVYPWELISVPDFE